MTYYVDLFSPETYEAFSRSDRTVSGHSPNLRTAAKRVHPGDKFVCYMTKLSRWVGLLEVVSESFESSTPIFASESDPYIVRFHVRPLVWLSVEHGIPIHVDRIWNGLSFTRGQSKDSATWTGKVRRSLGELSKEDGAFLESAIRDQENGRELFPVDEAEYRRYTTHRVRRADKDVTVTVPTEPEPPADLEEPANEVRESIRMQALLAEIGSRMGMQVWVPRSDRAAVLGEWRGDHPAILERLPLNYEETTLKTIEQIDVLWLRGRSISRAFEVEHTTSIYSGILRMADLLALQPNLDIRLHIVAPSARREKVFQELRRPVFSLLDRGPLSESCTYLSYDSLRELASQPHLGHLSSSVLDEYEEAAED